MEEILLKSQERYQLINITDKVREIIRKIRVESGMVLVFVPHSTAGLLITENEEGLKKDWLKIFEELVSGKDFFHNRIDNNGDSHILAGLIGQHKIMAIKNNDLVLGTWQNIFLVEFDGPRTRKIIIKTIGD